MILEFAVSADGDDVVFLEDGLGISAESSIDGDFLHVKEFLGIGSGQMIYLCEDGIEPWGCDCDVFFLQFREAVCRNFVDDLAADSGVFDAVKVAAENISQFLENKAISGVVLDENIADHVSLDSEI